TMQLQGFFNIPVDPLFASPVLVDYFRKLNLPNLTVVSPDAGGVERARFFAKKMDAALAIVDKRRVEMNVAEVMNVIGDVSGRTCLIIDDLIDTAGTLVKVAQALVQNGANTVYACCTHPVLSGAAVENIVNSPISELVVTDTIPLSEAANREPGTKNAARRVRVSGKIPAVVYGAGKEAASVAVDPRQVLRILKSESGHNTIFDLALDSDRVKAMIVDWQFEPIKGKLLH